MSTKVTINYPVEGTVLFSDSLRINYKLSNKSDPSLSKIAFILNDVTYTTSDISGIYQINNIPPGNHTLSGHLIDKYNKKIIGSEFDVFFTTHEEKLNVENKLTYVLKSTIPDFVKEDYPNFIIFLKAYYEWLYSSNNPFYAPLLSEDYKDIDRTPEYFVKYFKQQYLKDFPESLTKDKQTGTPLNLKTLIKNIISFYSSKGTEKSIKFLLKILYDTYSEIHYPKIDLFKSSDSEWIDKTSIKFTFSSQKIFDIKQKQLYQKNGETLVWDAFIDEIQVYKVNNKQIVEIFYSKANGNINFTLPFEVDTFKEIILLSPVKVVSTVTVQEGGLNYKINDLVEIKKITTDEESSLVCLARVSQVNSTGSIEKIQIINFMHTQDIVGKYSINVVSDNGFNCLLAVKEGYICDYEGFWINKNSHPDSIKVIPDNYRYQNMSYVIRTNRSLDRYLDPLKKLAHPAGMAVIGDVLIQNKTVEPVIIEKLFNLMFTPLIGNYIAYRLNTNVNVRSSPDLFPNGFDPSRPIPDQDGSDTPHVPITPISEGVSSTVFGFVPTVSDANQINNYWVVYPHPNTEINTNTSDFMDIKLSEFIKQEK